MVELIRKLTSNYDEKDYRDWLWGDGVDFKEKEEIDWPNDRNDYVEVAAPDDTYIFINRSLYKKVDIGDIVRLSGNEDFKDIDIMLDEIACRTGYSKEFLSKMLDIGVKDGQTYEEAFEDVAVISHEVDW